MKCSAIMANGNRSNSAPSEVARARRIERIDRLLAIVRLSYFVCLLASLGAFVGFLRLDPRVK